MVVVEKAKTFKHVKKVKKEKHIYLHSNYRTIMKFDMCTGRKVLCMHTAVCPHCCSCKHRQFHAVGVKLPILLLRPS
jgi:hypothetical protein